MTAHILDYYMDGHTAVSFCKVCSAEGLQLLDTCSQKIIIHDPNFDLTDNKKRLKKTIGILVNRAFHNLGFGILQITKGNNNG